jgi:hypothetical protein
MNNNKIETWIKREVIIQGKRTHNMELPPPQYLSLFFFWCKRKAAVEKLATQFPLHVWLPNCVDFGSAPKNKKKSHK